MKKIALFLISVYQCIISPLFHHFGVSACRYPVSCSQYTKDSIKKYGLAKGGLLGLRRLSTCYPFAGHHSELGSATR